MAHADPEGAPPGAILTLNAGSSSLKFAVFTAASPPERLLTGAVNRIGRPDAKLEITFDKDPSPNEPSPNDPAAKDPSAPDLSTQPRALEAILARLEPRFPLASMQAIAHRIVHGGPRFDRATIATPELLDALRSLRPLDPEHLPAEIAILEAMQKRAPETPQIASFDTAFHKDLPRVARLVPIPRRYEHKGIRRYGFHGLSYTFLLEELGRLAGEKAARGRLVLAHLGSGASLAAVREGRCIDTTMGFTPTSGIPMSTRSGDLDPGVLLYLLREEKLDPDALDKLVNHESGLLGLSETSADMRDLLAREAEDPRAADAVALFCQEAKKTIGAFAAALSGLDTLVFAGGIGERAAPIRARITEGLEHLGVHLDPDRNASGAPVISTDASPCVIRVIKTDEESILAREAREALAPGRQP